MAKYSKAAGKKVEAAMKEMKKGTLKTGSGKKVTDKKQAIAIGLSEAKKKGAKVPAKKTASKKTAPAKIVMPVKKVAVKKAAPAKPVKKVAAKKAAPKKSAILKVITSKKAINKTAVPGKRSKVSTTVKAATKKVIARPVKKKAIAKKSIATKKNKTPKETPKKIINPLPIKEDINNDIPVQEPTVPAAVKVETKGNPIPQDIYSVSGDNYHGHTKPTGTKSTIKPSGKKPLWNK